MPRFCHSQRVNSFKRFDIKRFKHSVCITVSPFFVFV
ncbi:hypothetical protein [Listeria phage FHC174-PLM34]|nr:hypothetical protein [Listeria phage FHC174-PLM34]